MCVNAIVEGVFADPLIYMLIFEASTPTDGLVLIGTGVVIAHTALVDDEDMPYPAIAYAPYDPLNPIL